MYTAAVEAVRLIELPTPNGCLLNWQLRILDINGDPIPPEVLSQLHLPGDPRNGIPAEMDYPALTVYLNRHKVTRALVQAGRKQLPVYIAKYPSLLIVQGELAPLNHQRARLHHPTVANVLNPTLPNVLPPLVRAELDLLHSLTSHPSPLSTSQQLVEN